MSMFNKPQVNTNTVFSANQSLEAFFHNGVSLHKLKEGKYKAKMHNFALVPATTPEAKPYIRIELQLLEDGRIIVDNRFQTGFNIMIEQIKEQMGISDEDVAVQDLLNHCRTHQFTAWITYTEVEGKTYRNVSYRAPKELTPVEETAAEIVY